MPQSGCGTFLRARVPNGVVARDHFETFELDTKMENILRDVAHEDARRYVYNAVVTFLGALTGLYGQQSAWSVTKLYYCAFYIGRAALCRADRVIFHVPKPSGLGNTQYELHIQAGQRANLVTKIPSTHKLVAKRFQEVGYPSFMRGLEIDGIDPLLWLMEQREYWQYRSDRFPDPDFPPILAKIDSGKLQRLLQEYAADKTGIFLSDPDHAIVSIPFRLVTWALSHESLVSPGVVDSEDLEYLRRCCRMGGRSSEVSVSS